MQPITWCFHFFFEDNSNNVALHKSHPICELLMNTKINMFTMVCIDQIITDLNYLFDTILKLIMLQLLCLHKVVISERYLSCFLLILSRTSGIILQSRFIYLDISLFATLYHRKPCNTKGACTITLKPMVLTKRNGSEKSPSAL